MRSYKSHKDINEINISYVQQIIILFYKCHTRSYYSNIDIIFILGFWAHGDIPVSGTDAFVINHGNKV